MKSDAVDAWLQHWLKLQKKNKRPLVLKERPDKPAESRPAQESQRKGNRSSARPTERGKTSVEERDDADSNNANTDAPTNTASTGRTQNEEATTLTLPPSPKSAAFSRKSRRTFLESLSDNEHYQKMLLLLRAAKVSHLYIRLNKLTIVQDGDLLEGDGAPPKWVTWESTDNYLSDAFYNKRSTYSLSAFMRWASTDPITADGDTLASYKQVELVILGIGLAFRALWVAQFPEKFSEVPIHVINSEYPFSEYEQLGFHVHDLIAGYADTYVLVPPRGVRQYTDHLNSLQDIEDAYMALKVRQKQSASKRPSKIVSREKDIAGDKDTIEETALAQRKGQNRSGGQGQRRYVFVTTSQSMN